MNFLLIISGLIFLILGGNWLLKSAVALSIKLEIPKIVIGMTVVSFATSAPELIVSINAALNGSSDLALGNVIGSNIANLGLVLGITLLLGTMEVQKSFYKTDWPVMMIASALLYFFLAGDKVITQNEGFILFSFLILFLIYILRFQKTAIVDEIPEDGEPLPKFKIALFFALGGLGLWGGSELLIKGATTLAKDFGVTERVIGVTIISIGTSVPELAASIIAIIKKEKAISLGNLIGSNIFNILAVLGVVASIKEITIIDSAILSFDYVWMIVITFIISLFIYAFSKRQISRTEGVLLLLIYIAYLYFSIY